MGNWELVPGRPWRRSIRGTRPLLPAIHGRYHSGAEQHAEISTPQHTACSSSLAWERIRRSRLCGSSVGVRGTHSHVRNSYKRSRCGL